MCVGSQVYLMTLTFFSSLATLLELCEQVDADDGNNGEAPFNAICPKCLTAPDKRKKIMKRVKSRLETLNKRFKD